VNEHNLHNEQELLSLIVKGDEKAFHQVYEHYWLSLCDAAYKRLQNREEAEDVVQNIFVRLWIRRESLSVSNLSVYLFTAVRYGVLDHVTRTKKGTAFYEPFVELIKETESADDQLVAKDMLQLIYSYAETLPVKRREIFLLHIKNKLTTKEIADELNISQKTVQNQLNTALKGLHSKIGPAIILFIASRL
jgi:RNA polymerase sigma-70 factor (ECF subfamily)